MQERWFREICVVNACRRRVNGIDIGWHFVFVYNERILTNAWHKKHKGWRICICHSRNYGNLKTIFYITVPLSLQNRPPQSVLGSGYYNSILRRTLMCWHMFTYTPDISSNWTIYILFLNEPQMAKSHFFLRHRIDELTWSKHTFS